MRVSRGWRARVVTTATAGRLPRAVAGSRCRLGHKPGRRRGHSVRSRPSFSTLSETAASQSAGVFGGFSADSPRSCASGEVSNSSIPSRSASFSIQLIDGQSSYRARSSRRRRAAMRVALVLLCWLENRGASPPFFFPLPGPALGVRICTSAGECRVAGGCVVSELFSFDTAR